MFDLTSKRLWISVAIFILVVIVLATFVDWGQVSQLLISVDVKFLILGSVFLLAGYGAYAQRWRFLLNDSPKFMPTFHAANAGNLVNTLLPMRPGDAARIILLGGSEDMSMALITSSIVVERWFEQIMRLAALGGAMLFGMGMAVSIPSIVGAVVFMMGMYLLMLWMIHRREKFLEIVPPLLARLPKLKENSVRQGLENLINGLAGISSGKYLLMLLLWSCLTWGLFWLFHYCCFQALGIDTDTRTILSISLGALALVPPSATTLPGVYQVSMVVPLVLVGYDENLLTSYALVMNSIEMLWILILGIWGTVKGGYSLRHLLASSD